MNSSENEQRRRNLEAVRASDHALSEGLSQVMLEQLESREERERAANDLSEIKTALLGNDTFKQLGFIQESRNQIEGLTESHGNMMRRQDLLSRRQDDLDKALYKASLKLAAIVSALTCGGTLLMAWLKQKLFP